MIRVNLWPDPMCTGSVKWSYGPGVDVTYDVSDGGRKWNKVESTGPTGHSQNCADFYLRELPGGPVKLHARLRAYGGSGQIRMYSDLTPVDSASIDAGDEREVILSCERTASESMMFRVIPSPDEGCYVMFCEVNIELESTFDPSLPFFYYGTMPFES